MFTVSGPHPARNGHPLLTLLAVLLLIVSILLALIPLYWTVTGWIVPGIALLSMVCWFATASYAQSHTPKYTDPDKWVIPSMMVTMGWLAVSTIWMVGYDIWFYWPVIVKFFGG